MVRLCNDAGHRACNEFPIMAQLRYAIGRTVSFACEQPSKSNQKKPYRPPSPLPSNLSRFQHFTTDFSLSLSLFRSIIEKISKRRIRGSKPKGRRRECPTLPPIRSFIIFLFRGGGLPSPFSYFSSFLSSFLPSISRPTLSPALLDASLFFARRRFFSARSFNPFLSLSLSLSRSNSIQFAIFPS